MLGEVFKKANPDIQNPVTLRRLIVDPIEPENWMSMQADVKGDIYEGLLARSAAESPKGAGQSFTPRELIKAIVDRARSTAADTVGTPPRVAPGDPSSLPTTTWSITRGETSTRTRRST
ncbi:MAG: N-6 DNA methylase [Isosphaeraceae bacterium]